MDRKRQQEQPYCFIIAWHLGLQKWDKVCPSSVQEGTGLLGSKNGTIPYFQGPKRGRVWGLCLQAATDNPAYSTLKCCDIRDSWELLFTYMKLKDRTSSSRVKQKHLARHLVVSLQSWQVMVQTENSWWFLLFSHSAVSSFFSFSDKFVYTSYL